MSGSKRVLSFTPEQEFFAKGCHGINGRWEVPTLGPTDKNDFLTRLFDDARSSIIAETDAFNDIKTVYDAAMAEGRKLVEAVVDVETANASKPLINEIEHALTSKEEIQFLFGTKAKTLGLFYDKVLKKYTLPPEEKKEEQ
jgi:hypothetical protein